MPQYELNEILLVKGISQLKKAFYKHTLKKIEVQEWTKHLHRWGKIPV